MRLFLGQSIFLSAALGLLKNTNRFWWSSVLGLGIA